MGRFEDDKMIAAVDKAVADGFIISGAKKFIRANEKELKKTLDSFIKDVTLEAKTYVGPASGKPKVPGFLGMRRKKTELAAEIRLAFMEKVWMALLSGCIVSMIFPSCCGGWY